MTDWLQDPAKTRLALAMGKPVVIYDGMILMEKHVDAVDWYCTVADPGWPLRWCTDNPEGHYRYA